MDNLFKQQLAGLDLSGLTISNSPFTSSDFPACPSSEHLALKAA